jgi:hypothetical protein
MVEEQAMQEISMKYEASRSAYYLLHDDFLFA